MNCKNFQDWLLKKDIHESPVSGAMEHLETCRTCARIYNLDTGLDNKINSAFNPQALPNTLLDQIDITLNHASPPVRVSKLKVAGLAAVCLLVSALVLKIFFNAPFQYQNLQQLSENVVASHLKGNNAMSFSSDDIESASTMLTRELKFNVIFPELRDKGYVLLGGRLCVLGKCKIAYLFYEKQNKVSSLIIMSYDHLDFEMAEGSRFSNDIKGYHTDIWKENGQVYAMVY